MVFALLRVDTERHGVKRVDQRDILGGQCNDLMGIDGGYCTWDSKGDCILHCRGKRCNERRRNRGVNRENGGFGFVVASIVGFFLPRNPGAILLFAGVGRSH